MLLYLYRSVSVWDKGKWDITPILFLSFIHIPNIIECTMINLSPMATSTAPQAIPQHKRTLWWLHVCLGHIHYMQACSHGPIVCQWYEHRKPIEKLRTSDHRYRLQKKVGRHSALVLCVNLVLLKPNNTSCVNVAFLMMSLPKHLPYLPGYNNFSPYIN